MCVCVYLCVCVYRGQHVEPEGTLLSRSIKVLDQRTKPRLPWNIRTIIFFLLEVMALFIYFNWRLITLQYCSGFCHTLTWIIHGCTCVPHPEPTSHLPPHPIPQGHPRAPALSTLSHVSNLDWQSVSHIIYMFQCYSLKSSHLLPQSPKVCALHLCLFHCLAYRLIYVC